MTAAWITGWGAIGPQGVGRDSVLDLVRTPRVCIQPAPAEWLQEPGAADTYVAALDASAEQALKGLENASTDRACAMALTAAEQAWTQAGSPQPPARRAGVYWGTGMGGLHTLEASYRRLLLDKGALRPMTVVRIMGNSAAAQLAIRYKLTGPNQTYTVACASSAMALGEALLAIRAGRVDIALVGGSEAMLVPGVAAAWSALRVLSTRKNAPTPEQASRPFGAGRAGLVLGEGAAAFVLESEAHARARGIERPLATLVGYGSNCDAGSLVHPSAEGQIDAMHQAIGESGFSAAQIGSINAHATGTDAGDVQEAQALAAVFGTAIPPVAATKSMHGHLLGAAGALEAAICLASLELQMVPGSPGCMPLDPRVGDLPVAEASRAVAMDALLSNSFAFGGANVSLVFGR